MNPQTLELYSDLLLMSKKVEEELNIVEVIATIQPIIELDAFKLPLTFICEALHPGIFKGVTLEKSEIISASQSFFQDDVIDGGTYVNWEINKSHRGNRRSKNIDDVIGKITKSYYDHDREALVLSCQISDSIMARKIYDGVAKSVSLRIHPAYIEVSNGKRIGRNLKFEELSMVRVPGDPDVKIIKIL